MDKRLQYYLDNPDERADEELAPLVEVAHRLNNAPRPTLSDAARSRIEARLLAPNVVSFRGATTRRLLFRMVAAFVVVVLFIGGGTAWASDDALPGETLYPVKRLVEQTRLSLATSKSAEINLRMGFAEQRLKEFDQLLDDNIVELEVIEDANDEVMRIQSLSDSDTTRRNLIAITHKQQGLLKEAQAMSPRDDTIQSLTSDIEDRLLSLRLPDLSVCEFEFWKAQPALWSDVVITLNGETLDQSAILSRESDDLFEQFVAMKLNIVNNNAAESELLTTAEATLSGTAAENASEDLAVALASQCEQQQQESSSEDGVNVDTAAPSGNNNSGDAPTSPSTSDEIDCSNPPPPHAPAVGWRERCGVPGPEPGNNGNGQGNQDNKSNQNDRGAGRNKTD